MNEKNKLKVMVFDTETTWLFSKKEKNLDKQPYIIQFSGILVEMDEDWKYTELKRINQFIKPPIKIPVAASQVHWIYDIDVINQKPFSSYAELISKWIEYPDIIVWHNVSFDQNMLLVEFQRIRMKGSTLSYNPKKVICTMNESVNYCKLPKKNIKAEWYKKPKLQELIKKLYWYYFKWAHDAMVDVEWTLKAFSKLIEKKVIPFEKNNTLTLF